MKSDRLRSLWDLLQAYAWNLVNHTASLTSLREDLRHRLDVYLNVGCGPSDVTQNDKDNINAILGIMEPWLKGHDLTAALFRCARLREMVNEKDEEYQPVIREVVPAITTLLEAIEDELERRQFLYLPPEDATLFTEPLNLFPKSRLAFPSAQSSMVGACQCLALSQPTACVFHCMGIIQAGLYAFANSLGVSFQFPLSLAEWHQIIERAECKIAEMRSLPRGEQKDDALHFYSAGAVQFRYFKDAWRNHVAHMREDYDRDQARSVLMHVSDFMEHISTRLTELPLPKLEMVSPATRIVQ